MKSACCSVRVLLVTTIVFLVLFVGSLILSFVGFGLILDDQVAKSVRLEKGTIQWERFLELPFDLDFRVFFFHITNANEVQYEGAKPILEEKGPYVYKQRRRKSIISENDDEDTVTYGQTESFTFDPDLSTGLENDTWTVVNPAMLSIIQMSTEMEQFISNPCLSKMFKEDYNSLFLTKATVRELLFDGIWFALNAEGCFLTSAIVRMKASGLRNSEPVLNADGSMEALKFSYFGFKDGIVDGIYTVNRGRDDVSKLGSIIRWNGDTDIHFWGTESSINNDTCSKVRGTDSTLYPPNVDDDADFEIFNTDICRSIKIKNVGNYDYKSIEGTRFETTKDTLSTSYSNKSQDCYCTKQTLDVDNAESCYLDGVIDMKPCFGAPVLFSFPHFLWADEKYSQAVTGLEPDEEKHKIFLMVEPNTGTPLQGMKRVQLNVVLRPEPYVYMAQSLAKAVLPVLWIEEGVALEQEYIDELQEKYFDKLKVIEGLKYGLIFTTAAGVAVAGSFLIRQAYFKKK